MSRCAVNNKKLLQSKKGFSLRERSALVIGHSHVGAIRHAAVRRREAGGVPHLFRTINVTDPRFGDPATLKLNGDLIPSKLLNEIKYVIDKRQPMVFTALGGNAHTMLCLARWDEPWDFELKYDGSLPLESEVTIIPEIEARRMLTTTMADELGALTRLKTEIGSFSQIESPPPVASPEFIKHHIERYFVEQSHYVRNGVSPIGLRYRMWRLSCQIFEEHCRAIGCGYIKLPEAVFDPMGCLNQNLAANATHGNIEFGQHIIEKLDRLLER